MFGLGVQELLVILAIAALLFGAKRLPELGKSLGMALRGFKAGVAEEEVAEQEDKALGEGVPDEPAPGSFPTSEAAEAEAERNER